MTNKYHITLPYKYNTGKMSAFTPLKGSMTVEAAMAVPIFFFAVICLIYLFEIMAIQTAVQSGLQYAGKIIMEESYPLAIINPASVEEKVVNAIGTERMERSILEGGSTGIDCSGSYMSLGTGIGKLKAEYQIRIPVPFFYTDGITRTESVRIKAWTGYEKGIPDISKEDTVYVTETGLVYHKDYHCTYLDLSIRKVEFSAIDSLRNTDGGKYYA